MGLFTGKIEPNGGLLSGDLGGIIKCRTVIKTDTFTTTSSSFTPITGLVSTIPPTSASSQFPIFLSVNMTNKNTSQRFVCGCARYRADLGTTEIGQADADGSRTRAIAGGQDSGGGHCDSLVGMFLDAPATTTQLEYRATTVALDGGENCINRTNSDANATSYARFASYMIVMEIGG